MIRPTLILEKQFKVKHGFCFPFNWSSTIQIHSIKSDQKSWSGSTKVSLFFFAAQVTAIPKNVATVIISAVIGDVLYQKKYVFVEKEEQNQKQLAKANPVSAAS